MCFSVLQDALADLPQGGWAVGVSGGADSMALLVLLLECRRTPVHVVHLDHQTRRGQSGLDAEFVRQFCLDRQIPFTIARRDQLEPHPTESGRKIWPSNRSARFRAMRLALFRRVIQSHGLNGVMLAHHADDQAETIFQRLLRGSPPTALAGMRPDGRVGGVRVLRPLLGIRSIDLRTMLAQRGIAWREDASNASPAYQRNRVRQLLRDRPDLVVPLLELGRAASRWTGWLDQQAPVLPELFDLRLVQSLPRPVARRSRPSALATTSSSPMGLPWLPRTTSIAP